ncbi:hypothetical protein J1605_001945 [Eschrichtius robustus]|uniref:DNA-dependent protein kinase catalytic subunit CC1/2 domain-containing protein n=1 Tax=Eschrichtius robustus TaxID=9764 RepID=A0AB34I2E6_ESCRO|nr:hypothetical protein J1605_001945 [Eschrichtius robustus]
MSIDETRSNWEVSALSRAAQKGFTRDVLKHLKRTKNISSRFLKPRPLSTRCVPPRVLEQEVLAVVLRDAPSSPSLVNAVVAGIDSLAVQRLAGVFSKGESEPVTSKSTLRHEALSLEEIRVQVVQVLGRLGGQISKNLITAVSPEERARRCVAWDRERRLGFAVPFADMKPIIHLDPFLPRVTELALSAGDRQTKVLTDHPLWLDVAACELLHSIVMFMLGKATQMPDSGLGPPPMHQLYKRTFPVLLRLACDVDQVSA